MNGCRAMIRRVVMACDVYLSCLHVDNNSRISTMVSIKLYIYHIYQKCILGCEYREKIIPNSLVFLIGCIGNNVSETVDETERLFDVAVVNHFDDIVPPVAMVITE